MIYVVRYSDGSCAIVEGENEINVRDILADCEEFFNPETDKIVEVRPLSCPFVSRWYFDDKDKDVLRPDKLSGSLAEHVTDDVFRHEYPAIFNAHEQAYQESLKGKPTLEKFDRWLDNKDVRAAVGYEINRFREVT